MVTPRGATVTAASPPERALGRGQQSHVRSGREGKFPSQADDQRVKFSTFGMGSTAACQGRRSILNA